MHVILERRYILKKKGYLNRIMKVDKTKIESMI
jgi:hypothetical protein